MKNKAAHAPITFEEIVGKCWSCELICEFQLKKTEKKPVAHKYELSTTSNHKCQTNNLSKPEFFKDSFL